MKALLLVLLAYCSYSAAQLDCDENEISCANGEKCIPHRYICDRDDDCDDSSDEDVDICDVWRNNDCERNEVQCKRFGDINCVPISSYCTLSDPPCDGDLDKRLCQMLDDGVLDTLSNIIIRDNIELGNLNKSLELADTFRALVPYTLSHVDCPPLHTLVGDQCLSIFHVGSMSWGESREFCRILGGDLITFKNISHFSTVVQHLQQNGLQSNFWIGGSLANASEGWTWVDSTPMDLGSPFWATRYSPTCVERNVTVADEESVCFHYRQAPEVNALAQCVSLSFEHYFYMSDEDCVKKMSPLCVYQGPDNGPRRTFKP